MQPVLRPPEAPPKGVLDGGLLSGDLALGIVRPAHIARHAGRTRGARQAGRVIEVLVGVVGRRAIVHRGETAVGLANGRGEAPRRRAAGALAPRRSTEGGLTGAGGLAYKKLWATVPEKQKQIGSTKVAARARSGAVLSSAPSAAVPKECERKAAWRKPHA